MGKHVVAAAALIVGLFTHLQSARADFINFSASSGSLSASVSFESSGEYLIITLTNTSSADVLVPANVLTGVFFNTPGDLSAISANVASGSSVNGANAAGNAAFPNVAGEWAFATGVNLPGGATSGLSSAGLGVFGNGDMIGSPNLEGPDGPNGLGYGITSAGDNPATGNGGISGTPLIQNSVVFVLSGWNDEWSINDISDVYFQYGTALDEPNLPGVPEPGVVALMTLGLVGVAFGVRRMSWA